MMIHKTITFSLQVDISMLTEEDNPDASAEVVVSMLIATIPVVQLETVLAMGVIDHGWLYLTFSSELDRNTVYERLLQPDGLFQAVARAAEARAEQINNPNLEDANDIPF